jgi:hypothetical protein
MESCTSVRSFYIVNRYYSENDKEYAIDNVYKIFTTLEIDTILIKDWDTVYMDTISSPKYMEQKISVKKDDAVYDMEFRTFYDSDTTFYNYILKCTTKNYNIWMGL